MAAAPISINYLAFRQFLAFFFGNYAKPILQGLVSVQTYQGFGSI
jgi:hypothetical protein